MNGMISRNQVGVLDHPAQPEQHTILVLFDDPHAIANTAVQRDHNKDDENQLFIAVHLS